MRMIDADALIEDVDGDLTDSIAEGRAIEKIMNAPTIEERKTGKWIYGEDEYGIDGYHCDKCGFFVLWDYVHKFINYIDDYNFCPSCGADMRGEGHERSNRQTGGNSNGG